jgi:two-component system, sensor histidine kinase PdtaS
MMMSHPPGQAVDSLTLAVIASSNAPVLLLDGHLAVVAASTSFCQAFGVEPEQVVGRPLSTLGVGEWDTPQLASLLQAIASGRASVDAYEMDLNRPGRDSRCLVLHARKLAYGDVDNVRLTVAFSDITEARLAERQKEEMLREKAMLLQELQHRVANSLQIIASVLMQSARRVPSDETRVHLQDAHQRVMSIASMQKQLAVSGATNVGLRVYFTDLCRSIGASMIDDQNRISLSVTGDEGMTSPDMLVSLGLIVTELVINALKHAFPGHRAGQIRVDYRCHGAAWTLSVADNGVGMPTDPKDATPGLGTSIVKALAKHLGATVAMTDTFPGTTVSIIHAAAAAT